MKKIVALLMATLMVLSLSFAFAEETLTLTYDVKETENIEGGFVVFDEFGLAVFVPNSMEFLDLTEEQKQQGGYELYANADKTQQLSIGYAKAVDANGAQIADLDALVAMYVANGLQATKAVINDLPCVSYVAAEQGLGGVVFLTEDGNQIVFNFAPITDPAFGPLSQIMVSSIMSSEGFVDVE